MLRGEPVDLRSHREREGSEAVGRATTCNFFSGHNVISHLLLLLEFAMVFNESVML